MKHGSPRRFFIPDILLFAGTRVTLGIGIGLLLARRINNDQRKAAGIALTAVSGLTTIPLVMRFAYYRGWYQGAKGERLSGGCGCGCPCCSGQKGESASLGETQQGASVPAA